MATWLKRLFWLSLLSGVGYAGWALYASRQDDDAASAPEWPPLDPPEPKGAGGTTANSDPAPSVATSAPKPPAPQAEPASFADASGVSAPGADQPGSGDQAQPTASDRWKAPIDGACPPGYPVKANDNSGIFHVPGGRFYERTVPERCYQTPEDAAADGYRAPRA